MPDLHDLPDAGLPDAGLPAAGPVAAGGSPARPPRRPTADRTWLLEHYVARGLTLAELGRLAGVSESRMSQALRRHGIAARRGGVPGAAPRPFRVARLNDGPWLRRQYLDLQCTQQQIAQELGVSPGLVGRAMRRHGIAARAGGGGRPSPVPALADGEQLRGLRVVHGLPVAQIATRLGASPAAVYRALRTHGLAVTGAGLPRTPHPGRGGVRRVGDQQQRVTGDTLT